jgi:hypothetical protein
LGKLLLENKQLETRSEKEETVEVRFSDFLVLFLVSSFWFLVFRGGEYAEIPPEGQGQPIGFCHSERSEESP